MIRAASIRRSRLRRSSRTLSIEDSRSRKTENGKRKTKGLALPAPVSRFPFPVSRLSPQSPEPPALPPVAPREDPRRLEKAARDSRRRRGPERLRREENERRAQQQQREQRHDHVVDERGRRQSRPDRPCSAENHPDREDRE